MMYDLYDQKVIPAEFMATTRQKIMNNSAVQQRVIEYPNHPFITALLIIGESINSLFNQR